MKLKNNGIYDPISWKDCAPPMGGDKQWKDGRSAKELAIYMTSNYPEVPKEIKDILERFTGEDAEFDWAAEYVTEFQPHGLGRGEGRNHDAFMYNSDIVVGIEGKADESLGSQLIGDALKSASSNKMQRIQGMIEMLFGDKPENHKHIRYQLITASAATLLEANNRNVKNALLLVIVFKKQGYCVENSIKKKYYSDSKIQKNDNDIRDFLIDISAEEQNDIYYIPTAYGQEKGINLYFKKIEIVV